MNRTLPAEWYPQSGVMLTWPHKKTDFASELSRVEVVFCMLASIISQYEQVIICSSDEQHSLHIQHLLTQANCMLENVSLYEVNSDDSWARDHGPLTIIDNNQATLLDFKFNGWGNKYPHQQDDSINAALASQGAFKAALKSLGLILEGGSIDSNGKGTLLTTSPCLLSVSRNPTLSKSEIESQLKDVLGITTIHWLDYGLLIGDDTDNHIDMLARFVNTDTICHMVCDNNEDPHALWMRQLKNELQALRQTNGEPYNLVELPFPRAIYNDDGERLPASYCNFLIINKAVLLPIYDCPQDEQAIKVISDCFPDRVVFPIDCRSLIEQHGSLHCITMQLPIGALPDKHC